MTSRRLLDVLVRHWLLVAACAVLGAVLGFGISLQMPASYTVRTELFLASTGGNPEDRLQNGEYIRTRVATYAGLVTTPVFLEAVRENLGIPDSERQVADDVSAINPLDTALIEITVADSSAQRAEAVADQIGRVADTVIARLEVQDAGGSPVKVTVVQPAVAPPGPDSPSPYLRALIGLVVGMVVGAGAGLLLDARAQRRRSSDGHVDGVPVVSEPRIRSAQVVVGPADGTEPP